MTCHSLIDAGRWAELGRRSLDLYRASRGPLTLAEDTAIVAALAPLRLQSLAHRTGTTSRIGGAS